MFKLVTWSTECSKFDGRKTGAIRGPSNCVNAAKKDVHVLLAVGFVSVKVCSSHRTVVNLCRLLQRSVLLVLFA